MALKREAVTGAELARWNMEVRHMVWYCRPWYQRALLTILGRAP